VARVAAEVIEQPIVKALRAQNFDRQMADSELLDHHLLRAQIGQSEIQLSLRLDEAREAAQSTPGRTSVLEDSLLSVPWVAPAHSSSPPQKNGTRPFEQPDQKLIQAQPTEPVRSAISSTVQQAETKIISRHWHDPNAPVLSGAKKNSLSKR
jgi:hypothetical protein